MTTLVMWSGGVDSTAGLVKTLRQTEEPVIALHLHLATEEYRSAAEARAIEAMMAVLAERTFEYRDCSLDLNGAGIFPWDMTAVCFAAGSLARGRADIDRLVIGTCKGEGHWKDRWERIEAFISGAMWPKRPIHLEMPCAQMTKAEEMAYLGREVAERCWGCRTPVGIFMPCGTCPTCKSYRDARRELGWEPDGTAAGSPDDALFRADGSGAGGQALAGHA